MFDFNTTGVIGALALLFIIVYVGRNRQTSAHVWRALELAGSLGSTSADTISLIQGGPRGRTR